MTVTVYHNPRCSKSRETVKLLEDRDISFESRLYLQNIPDKEELQQIISLLGFSSARQLMRTKESIYKTLALAEENDEDALLNAMVENPKLIERPIVIVDDKRAKIGRPPESVLTLFD
ncbi:MAG: arsenate reductase (glutaredoxin) [Gammaproteobacteria bacterium]|nr:MAG: arsenate reductase (glutaredoxin) [Gammaproteobacteria bacterium]